MLSIDWRTTLDFTEKMVTISALVLGGLAAYYKFFKGRTFHPRLQPDVSGTLIRNGEVVCLLITIQLKNVGVSSVYFSKEGTRIDLYSYGVDSYLPTPHLAIWQHLETFSILDHHKWIESGEAIKDQLLIPIANDRHVAYKIAMTVNAEKISFRSNAVIEWKDDDESNQHGKDKSS
jgi:hypothetical protein